MRRKNNSTISYETYLKRAKSKIGGGVPLKNFIAGAPPYLRGPYSTMYCKKPWTIRQYAGFSTAQKSNHFYKKCLKSGQKGLSVAFDLATHRGFDSDNSRVEGDVGMAGVAIDSVEDMKILFNEIPLDKISVSMTMNGAILPIMAFFLVAAEESNVDFKHLSGTIQNDILKEFMVRNTYIYPPEHSMKITVDIIRYLTQNVPKFNPISISGYHMQEAGATVEMELGYTLANGLEYVKKVLDTGLSIDEFAPRLSFFWGVGMSYFEEIAKLRAARILWAKLMNRFNPSNPKSLMLRMHCQTSGWSLTAQEPFNNITRTTIEACAAVLGGTQSLHTNSLDEALALPSDFSSKIARNTQIYLQKETLITKTVDPFGGSDFIEKLTLEISEKAWDLIQEVEKLGGMTKAMEVGLVKKRIEEAAAEKQAKIDSNQDIIVGVNQYKLDNVNLDLQTLKLDIKSIRKGQKERLEVLKANRNENDVKLSLENLTHAASTNKQNLLEAAICAARSRATLGEISTALEKVYGRHKTNPVINEGVYQKWVGQEDDSFIEAKEKLKEYYKFLGRKPRIVIAKVGQDGHDRGAQTIAAGLSDIGFEVFRGELFQTPDEVVQFAIDNKADLIGVSSMTAAHVTIISEISIQLKIKNQRHIALIIGGIIPKEDHKILKDKGVSKIYGPGSKIGEMGFEILKFLISRMD